MPFFPPHKRQLFGIHTVYKRLLSSETKSDSTVLERWLQNWTATSPVPLFNGAEPPTALSWARRRGPRDAPLPDAILHKLFRNEAIRVWEPSTGQVKRVKKTTLLPLGARLLFPQNASTHSEEREAENPSFLRRKNETTRFKSTNSPVSAPSTVATAAAAAMLRNSILFQDRNLIAINKPPGLAVQGGSGVKMSVDSLLPLAFPEYYLNKKTQKKHTPLSSSPSYDDHLKLVHRLDREVTGVLLLGKGSDATARLAEAFRGKSLKATGSTGSTTSSKRTPTKESKALHSVVQSRIEKVYWAIVVVPFGSGIKKGNVGYLDAPIIHSTTNNEAKDKISATTTTAATTAALTRYKVLLVHTNSNIAWLELEPLTGRKHQLRQHCARELGVPILGDSKYGLVRKEPQKSILSGILSAQKGEIPLFLHCRSIKIDIPGQKKGILVEAQVPEAWQRLLNQHGWPLP
jgi:23S rRNA-/tRNA-specific pseudouridylate synthase